MPQYSLSGNTTVTTTYKTLASIAASTTNGNVLRRGRIYDFMVGNTTAPVSTDCAQQWDLSRQTASGTPVSGTPNALDPADSAFTGIANITHSAEPTYTSSSQVWNVGGNQRASLRWQATGPDAEFIYPATTANGFGLRTLSTGFNGTANCTLLFRE